MYSCSFYALAQTGSGAKSNKLAFTDGFLTAEKTNVFLDVCVTFCYDAIQS